MGSPIHVVMDTWVVSASGFVRMTLLGARVMGGHVASCLLGTYLVEGDLLGHGAAVCPTCGAAGRLFRELPAVTVPPGVSEGPGSPRRPQHGLSLNGRDTKGRQAMCKPTPVAPLTRCCCFDQARKSPPVLLRTSPGDAAAGGLVPAPGPPALPLATGGGPQLCLPTCLALL